MNDVFMWLYENKITTEELEEVREKIRRPGKMDRNDWDEALTLYADILDFMIEKAADV